MCNFIPLGITLVTGAAVVLECYVVGKGSLRLYNKVGQGLDLVGISGADSVCR